MRFHVVSLPHTATSDRFICCAYSMKVVKFCAMMMSLKHEVFLYAAEENEAECTECIPCTTPWAPEDYCKAGFEPSLPHWVAMNNAVIEAIKQRIQPHDFICLIGGRSQQPIADAFPAAMSVEWGIGYSGVFSRYQIFESYAWMHACHAQRRDASEPDVNFFHDVIPNFFDLSQFPVSRKKDDYYLYVGRVNRRKGVEIAEEACARTGKRLIIAGPPGDYQPRYGEVVGPVGVKERGRLMSHAVATLVPTMYMGPFEGVAVESMLCGTPVITTDYGVFPEYVENGVNGYRCHLLRDFEEAIDAVRLLSPSTISKKARKRFDMNVVKYQYERYFERLLTLWGPGWYAPQGWVLKDVPGPV